MLTSDSDSNARQDDCLELDYGEDEYTDEENPRVVCSHDIMYEFDEHFSGKRYRPAHN